MAKWATERRWKEARRKAERINAKVAAEIPLFAEQVEKADPVAMFWHNVFMRAEGVERFSRFDGEQQLRAFQVRAIRDFARGHMTAKQFAGLDARCRQTYPSVTYWYDFWKRVLTGEVMPLRYEKVEDRQPGQPATRVVESWPPAGWQPPFTSREEFYAAFPYTDQGPPEDHAGAVKPAWRGEQ